MQALELDSPISLLLVDPTSTWSTLEWLSFFGNIGSLAGFLITLFVLWKAMKARNHYVLIARGPVLVKQLKKTAQRLFNHLNNDDYKAAKSELMRGQLLLKT